MNGAKQINGEILRLAVPSIMANITVPLVGMVDIAVAGHIGSAGNFTTAALIGGIAIGSMLFDLLYWNFGFLRVSTGGLTAQAYGRGDTRECARALVRSLSIAIGAALALIAIQWIFLQAAFLVVKSTPEVRELAQQYFYIRIWAAPATLSLMAFKGWFIGMQDSVSTMVTDLVINCVNIISSIVLSLGFAWIHQGGWSGMGFAGVALGTVTAQYSGLLCAIGFFVFKYREKIFKDFSMADARTVFKGGETGKFFSMNGDIFVRSLCFIAIYIGFTIISARYGDVLLATCSIMMKLLMIFSYFTDGFAYAGEAMAGKYIGARKPEQLRSSVRWNFVWCGGISVAFMFIYGLCNNGLLRLMTNDAAVIEQAMNYTPWLLLMPLAGCAAFAWDGIYIGATATRHIRNAMLWAVVAFFTVWGAGIWFFNPETAIASCKSIATPEAAVHLLMAAYFAHLAARTLSLTIPYRRIIFGSIS